MPKRRESEDAHPFRKTASGFESLIPRGGAEDFFFSLLADPARPYLGAVTFFAFLVVLYPLTGAFGVREVKVLAAVIKPRGGGGVTR